MIKNEKQYTVTNSRLNDFKESLLALAQQQGMYPLLKELHSNALKSQIEEFEKLIDEYKILTKGSVNYLFADNLSEINEVLVKARIANKLTQSDLAERLKLKEQQIQRYEASNYSAASMDRIIEVADALNLQWKFKVKINESPFFVPDGINKERMFQIKKQKVLLNL